MQCNAHVDVSLISSFARHQVGGGGANRLAGGASGSSGCCIQVGDRVALVYPNNDPISFLVAFYGCLTAGKKKTLMKFIAPSY